MLDLMVLPVQLDIVISHSLTAMLMATIYPQLTQELIMARKEHLDLPLLPLDITRLILPYGTEIHELFDLHQPSTAQIEKTAVGYVKTVAGNK
jgi:hypothetical protein